jgi:Transposase DDE domain
LAVTHGAIRTQYDDARITNADDLLRLVLVHVGANLPLRQTVAVFAESTGPVVSPNCLHKRMRKAAPYLQALVSGMTSWTSECEPGRWNGYDLILVDGSSFSGRCPTGTDARIHAALRLSDLSVVHAHASDASGGESLRRFQWQEGQLVIGDRGYCNAPGIALAVEHGADVLVRLNRGSLPLEDERGDAIDVIAWVRSLEDGQIAERSARGRCTLDGRVHGVTGRLVAMRLPADKIEEARKRVRKEQGRHITEETLEMAAYLVLFTTAPKARLPAARAIEAYRWRWQIELLFKRWKSICGYDRLPNERTDTVLSWLSAKILLGLIVERMAATAISPPEQQARRARRRADGVRPVEGHELALAGDHRGSDAATSP